MTRGGIAGSAALHLIVLALVVFGLPNLFRKPPPQDTPIAVQLVTIAPETRATHTNPFRPQPDAKPEPPRRRARADTRTEAATAGAEPRAAPVRRGRALAAPRSNRPNPKQNRARASRAIAAQTRAEAGSAAAEADRSASAD